MSRVSGWPHRSEISLAEIHPHSPQTKTIEQRRSRNADTAARTVRCADVLLDGYYFNIGPVTRSNIRNRQYAVHDAGKFCLPLLYHRNRKTAEAFSGHPSAVMVNIGPPVHNLLLTGAFFVILWLLSEKFRGKRRKKDTEDRLCVRTGKRRGAFHLFWW